MSLHDRLYAARATRALQDQQRWAEDLRGDDGARLASVTPMIPAPRVPTERVREALPEPCGPGNAS